jgi:hypothetical protein
MAKKDLRKTYNLRASIKVITAIEVQAETLEEALEKGRQLDTENFIRFLGDHIDSEFELTGIY